MCTWRGSSPRLLLITNRKSYMPFQLVQKWTTLGDLEWPYRTLVHKWCVFWSSLWKFERRQIHTISGENVSQDTSNYCGCYSCRLTCVHCHVFLLKIPHVSKLKKAKFLKVALRWDECTKLMPCSLSGSWASCLPLAEPFTKTDFSRCDF